MPPDVAVRPALPDDAAALARLRWEFRVSLGSAVETEAAFTARCAAWMRERLSDPDAWRAWVAVAGGEVGGEIVGTAWVGLIDKVPNPTVEAERHAYVTNVYVRDAYRGGTGSALVRAALAWCEAAGIHAAVLWPTERSAALYRRHGFREPDALLEREFGPGPERRDRSRDADA